jgi:peptidoglycan/xylan/chitin deacetylase (PgdA/CDA1 family)
MLKLKMLRSAPLAVAYWSGAAGRTLREDGRARILMLHGTPRRWAALIERVLVYVKRQFDVVPLAALASGRADVARPLAITFDDGLRNNVQVAYPMLERLGLTATFFVCPQLTDERAWIWSQEMRQRLLRLDSLCDLSLATGGPREVEPFVTWMKTLAPSRRREVEAKVRKATPNFAATAAERHEFELAHWEELRALDPRVATIGSHTLTHPILPSLDAGEVEVEVAQSRRLIEERLDREADLFAYPNGDSDAQVHACVRRHYRAAVTVEEGCVDAGCDRHLLPRINVPAGVLRLALALHRPYLTVTPSAESGSQVASSGNSVLLARQSTIMKKNGSEASAT